MSERNWKSVYDTKDMVAWYEKRAQIIAMKRDELDSAIINMIPYGKEKSIRVLELGSGTGHFTEKILQTFPHAIVTCVDGAAEMLKCARERLQKYRDRVTFLQLDLEDSSWHASLGKHDVVVSARAIHHLSDEEKRLLFQKIFNLLKEEGCFINGDMIKSKFKPFNHKYFDEIWAGHIKEKTKEILNIDRPMEEVRKRMYAALEREGDKPSTVEDQLQWLLEAGFKAADCVWKYYHMAVIVGLK